jgi:Flp pilus assembly protein TadD
MTAPSPTGGGSLSAGERAFYRGDVGEARAFFLRAASSDPALGVAWRNAGASAAVLRDLEAAGKYFGWLGVLEPRNDVSHLELGKVQLLLGNHAASAEALSKSMSLAPAVPAALVHYSSVLRRVASPEAAWRFAEWALTLAPFDPQALSELGNVLRERRDFRGAADLLGRSIAIEPNQPETLLTLAFCFLHLDDYALGWRFYEFRWRDRDFLRENRDPPIQRWSGQPEIKGLRLLLFSEQGFGDTIQFVRFIPELERFEAEITLLVPPELLPLLSGIRGVSRVVCRLAEDETFHACCSLMSLPNILMLTVDSVRCSRSPYLEAPKDLVQRWRSRLIPKTSPLIGVCWSGSANPRMTSRTISLLEFSKIFESGLTFVSLNRDVRPADRDALTNLQDQLRHFGDELTDFSVTAALIENMDVVVTVDTSVAHLAGSMGKEVWIMLPFNADWRWSEGRQDSFWYERVKLFRQSRGEGWNEVLSQMAAALTALRPKGLRT